MLRDWQETLFIKAIQYRADIRIEKRKKWHFQFKKSNIVIALWDGGKQIEAANFFWQVPCSWLENSVAKKKQWLTK